MGGRFGQGPPAGHDRWRGRHHHHHHGVGVESAGRPGSGGLACLMSGVCRLCVELRLCGDLLEQSSPLFLPGAAGERRGAMGEFPSPVLAVPDPLFHRMAGRAPLCACPNRTLRRVAADAGTGLVGHAKGDHSYARRELAAESCSGARPQRNDFPIPLYGRHPVLFRGTLGRAGLLWRGDLHLAGT